MAAQTVLRLREELAHIRLILILPCLTQAGSWPERDAALYEEIKGRADGVEYVSRECSRGCMQRRNRRLVEESGVCVCYLTQPSGGTAYTVRLARAGNLRVINLAGDKNKTGA